MDAYDASAAKITQLKIEWSVAKANVDSAYTSVLIPMLNTINEDTQALEAKLQGYGFAAKEHETEINDEVTRLHEVELWKVQNYTTYLANEAALIVVNDAIKAVKDELTAAKAEVAELVSPEVVAEFTGKLDAVSFDDVENSRDTHYASHDLNDETVKSQIINVDLKAISDAIAQIVEDAESAQILVKDIMTCAQADLQPETPIVPFYSPDVLINVTNTSTSGINNAAEGRYSDADAIYSINGVRTKSLQRGVNIVKKDGKTIKVVKK